MIPQIYKVHHKDKLPNADLGENDISTPRSTPPKLSAGGRIAMLTLGWCMIIISPIVGALPGPGFIILFPIGLAIVLKNSRWAKGFYIKFKRKFPDYGVWTDWTLRRKGQKEMPPFPPIIEQIKKLFKRSDAQ